MRVEEQGMSPRGGVCAAHLRGHALDVLVGHLAGVSTYLLHLLLLALAFPVAACYVVAQSPGVLDAGLACLQLFSCSSVYSGAVLEGLK